MAAASKVNEKIIQCIDEGLQVFWRECKTCYILLPRFMIIGINPGASKNYLSPNFEEYQNQIRQPISEQFWQYHYVTEIFGYPPLKEGVDLLRILFIVRHPAGQSRKKTSGG